ncbi:phosphatidate cytidylyltransferase [bacterium]|nr:phosphatidate cytidylyltransferase [bacterium]
MLKRIIVALVFLPLFVCLIALPNPEPFFIFYFLLLAAAMLEMGRLIQERGLSLRWSISLPIVMLMCLVAGYSRELGNVFSWPPGAMLWIIIISAVLLLSLREILFGRIETIFLNLSANVLAILIIGGIGSFVFLLRGLPQGSWWLCILFGFNWIYDGGALFCGKYFGRRKLAPAISPAKTIEGLIGGIAANAVIAVIAYLTFLPPTLGFTLAGFAGLGMLMGLMAQAGDLLESALKRWSGIKNSAGFIPGHGGVLDKIDSSFFTAPFLYAVARILMGA